MLLFRDGVVWNETRTVPAHIGISTESTTRFRYTMDQVLMMTTISVTEKGINVKIDTRGPLLSTLFSSSGGRRAVEIGIVERNRSQGRECGSEGNTV